MIQMKKISRILLINKHIKGAYRNWAIVGSFGDNLRTSALSLAKKTKLNESELRLMERLGVYINYNAYGSDLTDLNFNPVDLYSILIDYPDPLIWNINQPG